LTRGRLREKAKVFAFVHLHGLQNPGFVWANVDDFKNSGRKPYFTIHTLTTTAFEI
jgi:hypothetical protein